MSKLLATTTTEVTATVKLQPTVRKMLLERCTEALALAAQAKEIKRRRTALGKEVETLFTKAKQGKALVDGTDFEGHRIKMVFGKKKKVNMPELMKAFGMSQADVDEHTEEKDNTPYIKISKSGAGDDDDAD